MHCICISFCRWTMILCYMYKLFWQMHLRLSEWWWCFKKWAKAIEKNCNLTVHTRVYHSVIITYHYKKKVMHSFYNVHHMKRHILCIFQMRCWSKCLLPVYQRMYFIWVILNPIKASAWLSEWVQGQDFRHWENKKLNLYTSALIKFVKPVCLNSPAVM